MAAEQSAASFSAIPTRKNFSQTDRPPAARPLAARETRHLLSVQKHQSGHRRFLERQMRQADPSLLERDDFRSNRHARSRRRSRRVFTSRLLKKAKTVMPEQVRPSPA